MAASTSTSTAMDPTAPNDVTLPASSAVPLKYSSLLGVGGALQSKNMSSTFVKDDKQSYWTRRNNNADQVLGEMRQKKRARMLDPSEPPNGIQLDPSSNYASNGAGVDVKGKGRETATASSLADPDKVLVIHPGSRYLRFGRATDSLPIEIPNCIARKSPIAANGHTSSSSSSTRYKELSEEKLEILKLDLRARMRVLKLRGTTGGSIAASEYNKAVIPEDVPFETDENYLEWTDPSGNGKSVYFGEDALHLANPEQDGWKVKWPYRKGTFNTKDYTTSRELLGDIADMWMDALEKFCLIPPNKLEEYSVILLIPDLYDHTYITEMCDMMLKTIGFAQVILHQESLSATFAAGLPSACVIDIGACKTSISCIDEGMVINDSRMVMDFGSDDVIETFTQIMKTIDFPFKEVDLARPVDREMMQELFAKAGAFNEFNFGVNTYDFVVRRPDQPVKRYSIKMHDEVCLPTFCFWAPRILDWERKYAATIAGRIDKLWAPKDSIEDTIDLAGNAISAAMKKSVAHLTQPRMLSSISAGQPQTLAAPLVFTNSDSRAASPALTNVSNGDEGVFSTQVGVSKAGTPMPASLNEVPSIDYAFESGKLPLDVAVFESLAAAGGEDKIKRVATNILVVGGIANVQGVGFALQSRLDPLLKQRYPGVSPLVIPSNKYADPAHLAWKGVQSLCKLDVVSDMWIRRDDWDMMNVRALRDRSFFVLP